MLNAIYFWDDNDVKKFMYGWEVPAGDVDSRFTVVSIPETTWVVISASIEDDRFGVIQCYEDLYTNWFPTSPYNQAPNRPIIEKYPNQHQVELWIPITDREL